MSAVNSVKLTGRLTRDVTVFDNKDGSKTVVGNLAVRRSFQNTVDGEKKTLSDYIPFRHRVDTKTQDAGSWAFTGKGDLIAISAELRSSTVTAPDGTQYRVDVELDEFPTFLEPKSVTQARRATGAAAAATAGAAADVPAVGEGFEDQPEFPTE